MPEDCGPGCADCPGGCRVSVLLRPDDVVHDEASPTRAEVVAKAFRAAEFLYTLRLPSGVRVLSLVPSHHDHAIGESIGIQLDVDHVVVFHEPHRGGRGGAIVVRLGGVTAADRRSLLRAGDRPRSGRPSAERRQPRARPAGGGAWIA